MIQRINVEGLSAPPGYSHAVVASGGRLVATAGAVPLDPGGNLVGPGDCVAQTRQVLENLVLALRAVGAQGGDVVKTTVYVVSGNREDLAAVWSRGRRWPKRRARSLAYLFWATRDSSSRSKPPQCWSSLRTREVW